MTKLLKAYSAALIAKRITLKEETILSLISKAKAKGLSPDNIEALLLQGQNSKNSKGKTESISELIDDTNLKLYRDYEDTLRKNNSLDFDDLLVYGVTLFCHHSQVRKWCKHILVDEL